MDKLERKCRAQDKLLAGMANMILAYSEGVYGPVDEEMLSEMKKQAARAMNFFGVNSFPGLGN